MKVIIKGKNRFVFSEFPHESTLKKLGIRLSELSESIKAKIELFDIWNTDALRNGLTENKLDAMYNFSMQMSTTIKWQHSKNKYHGKA